VALPPKPDEDPRALETIVLIERHREGRREALDELFRRYEDRVRRIVRVRMGPFLRSRAEVDDVVQETMLQAFASLDQFELRDDAKMIHWMARIAENSLRNMAQYQHAQKRDAAREVPIESLVDKARHGSVTWDLASPTPSPQDKVSAQEMVDVVDECLMELPEDQREIILLVDFVGGSWEFVAQQAGRASAGAAKKFHRRARISLAALVDQRLRQ